MNKSQRFNPWVLITFVFIFLETLLVWLVHLIFAEPYTDVLGSPLLLPHGGRSLEIQIFVALQLLIIPFWLFLGRKNESKSLNWWRRSVTNASASFKKSPSQIEIIFLFVSLVYFTTVTLFSSMSYFQRDTILLKELILVLVVFIGLVLFVAPRLFPDPYVIGKKFRIQDSFMALATILIIGLSLTMKYWLLGTRLNYVFPAFAVLWAISYLTLLQKASSTVRASDIRNITVYLPTFALILYSRLSGNLNLNSYESFSYVNAKILLRGGMPWRDFTLEHGLWEDALRPLLGGLLSENSAWGQSLGVNAIIIPLEVSVVAIVLYLVSKNVYLTLTLISVNSLIEKFFSQSAFGLPRMLPIVILTVVLRVYLRNPRLKYAIAVGALGGFQILWAQEGIYAAFASLGVIIFFGLRSGSTFKKYIGHFFVATITLLGCWALPLISLGLFTSWIQRFMTDSSGYLLAWGGNFQFNLGFNYVLFLFLIPLTGIYFITKNLDGGIGQENASTKKRLWLMPIVITYYAYFIKFLEWPDWHLGQSISIFLLGSMILVATTQNISYKSWISITMIIATLVMWTSLNTTGNEAQYRKPNSILQSLGPTDAPTNSYIQRIIAVQGTFSKWIPNPSSTTLLDFGNEPVSWFEVLGYRPAGGVTKVLNLFSASSQEKLVKRLTRDMPDAVIWGGEYGYWSWPFNGNWMKQYLLTDFILKNYSPVSSDGNYVLMLPSSKYKADSTSLSKVMSVPCDWMNGAEHFKAPQKILTSNKILTTSPILTSDGLRGSRLVCHR